MSSSTIIQLKELRGGADNGVKDQPELPNGFFKQVLKNPITIENQDQLSIHSGFIDTIESSQGKITVDGTEEYTIGYTPFIQNYDKQAKVYNGQTPSVSAGNGQLLDNEPYYPCAGGHTPSGDCVIVNSITFVRKASEEDNWGDVSGFFFFRNEAGVDTGIQITIPPIKNTYSPAGYATYDAPVNKVCRAGTFRYGESEKDLKKFKRKGKIGSFSFNESSYNPSNLNLEPLAFEFKFTLPAGSYEPKHICELITEKLTDMNNTAQTPQGYDDNPVNNAFLKTSRQINAESGAFNGEGKCYYVSSNGAGVLQLPDSQHFPNSSTDPAEIVPGFSGNTYDSFVGSDQVVLDFDEDLQKCVWSQLHSNIYSEGSSDGGSGYNEDGSIVVKSFPHEYTPPTDGTQQFIYGSRNGCVGFNYLTPSDFWFGDLGLDPAICFSFEPEKVNQSLGALNNIDTYKVKGGFFDGIHTTNSVVSNSVAITKNQFFNQVPSRSSLEGTSTANVKCYGLNSLNSPTLEEGYFLISIDGFDNNQKLISKDDERNTIKSIVSRFYTTNSYTSFYNEGNIQPYTHYGEPITISSFNVRILNPEYEQANIQSDNTIFLELIKPLEQFKK
jgi:hypothetical protein